MMLKIGDFSRISQVSIKTLRYYDEIGLLRPAYTDKFTSYRYYDIGQLPRLNRLLALKELGLSLQQIAQLLDESVSADEIRGMLRLKRAEVQQSIADEQARLRQVEFRLRQIEQEGIVMALDVVMKKAEAQRVIGVREIAATKEDLQRVIMGTVDAIMANGVKWTGQMMVLYHNEGFTTENWDVEVAVPTDAPLDTRIPLPGDRALTVRELAGGETLATLIHHGNYDTIDDTYIALSKWVAENGYKHLPLAREVYLRTMGDNVPPSEYLTDIQYAVEKK